MSPEELELQQIARALGISLPPRPAPAAAAPTPLPAPSQPGQDWRGAPGLGALLPLQFGYRDGEQVQGQNRLALPEALQPFANVLGLIEQSFSGGVPAGTLSDPQLLDDVAGIAGALGGGALTSAAPTVLREGVDPNVLNVFGGRQARVRPELSSVGHNADTVAKLTEIIPSGPNVTPDQNQFMWDKTGWFIGPEGMPKFEISDAPATLNSNFVKEFMGLDATDSKNKIFTYLGDILNHPALFEAYPDLANTEVGASRSIMHSGSYRAQQGTPPKKNQHPLAQQPFYVPEDIEATEYTPSGILDVLLHEIQHGIQSRERFATGGSPSDVGATLDQVFGGYTENIKGLDAKDIYLALMGEVEARNVQKRHSGRELHELLNGPGSYPPPFMTEPIPRNAQINPDALMAILGQAQGEAAEGLGGFAPAATQQLMLDLLEPLAMLKQHREELLQGTMPGLRDILSPNVLR